MAGSAQPSRERQRRRPIRRRSHAHAIPLAPRARSLGDRGAEAPGAQLRGQPVGVLATGEATELHRPAGDSRTRCAVVRGAAVRRCMRWRRGCGARRDRARWRRTHRWRARRRRLGHRCRRRWRPGCNRWRRGRHLLGRRRSRRCTRLGRGCRTARLVPQIDRIGAQRRLVGRPPRRVGARARTRQQLRDEEHDHRHEDDRPGQTLFSSQFQVGAKWVDSSLIERGRSPPRRARQYS